ncbi:EF-P beta-lysylation protein EpmB [Pseudidiomarina marina]|uniref:L-lysine 2,3-aminomutase n=1 Tax=Pseudidiomarina marina TaxID=502366 RepID=A0A432YEI3_9GAMM|nr:EF-P beta-lysylation protein EpmB [Pseudidiomarina marina]PHR66181.1 MAG: EF-P beta-lysylation protein EpmB [Idiomarina sp.]RUO59362.1 EF-P beta-lysylation protein EpmB [Pseudidiomarina marina]
MSNLNVISVRPQWQQELAQSISDPSELGALLRLPDNWITQNAKARELFPLRITRYFVGLMRQGDIHDPLLLQVMPNQAEFEQKEGFIADPLEEQNSNHAGILHKYKSRVLVILRGGCAINCRYCFRRHFPYEGNHFGRTQLQQLVELIQSDGAINEVILSGGDPLMANDNQLSKVISVLEELPQLKRLRIHSRLPIVLPSRLTENLAKRLQQSRLQAILVLHANHPREISSTLKDALEYWARHGITLLNQSVLLRGVNDSADTLVDLSEALFDAKVIPYYLHQLDKVAGASHFAVSDERARELERQLRARLPGFLVPKLVREIAGEASKTPL